MFIILGVLFICFNVPLLFLGGHAIDFEMVIKERKEM